jgi:hypothetical protein
MTSFLNSLFKKFVFLGITLKTSKPGDNLDDIRKKDSKYGSSPTGQLSSCLSIADCKRCRGKYDSEYYPKPDQDDRCAKSGKVSCYCESIVQYNSLKF